MTENEKLIEEARSRTTQHARQNPEGSVDIANRLADALEAAEKAHTPTESSTAPKHDESCAEWCNHCTVCGVGTRYGSRCPEHYQNQPQGEPSDAQVEDGCVAFYEGAQGLTSWARLVATDPDLANRYRDGIRAALRAAGVVGQEGESRG